MKGTGDEFEGEAPASPMAATVAVIKVGGATLTSAAAVKALSGHVQQRVARGEQVVVVHGGGPEIGALHDRLAVPFVRREGLRVTSAESLHLVTMVLCGLVNKRIVARFVQDGLLAVGLSGVDGGLLRAELLDESVLGRVGGVPRVDTTTLRRLLSAGFLPVVAPVSLAPDGGLVNVNADTAAHALAAALGAGTLDFVSDVPGVRLDELGEEVARRLSLADVERLIADGATVTGGMVPKLRSAAAAIGAGVGRVRVGDLAGMSRDAVTEVVA